MKTTLFIVVLALCALSMAHATRVQVPTSVLDGQRRRIPAAPVSPLFGLSNPPALIDLDITTGQPVGHVRPPLQHELQAQGLSTMDNRKGNLFFLGYNTTSRGTDLVGVDLATGKMTHDIALPFQTHVFVGVGQYIEYDPNNDTIIAVGHDPSVGTGYHLVRISLTTHTITSVAKIVEAGLEDLLGAPSAFDADNNIFYMQTARNVSGEVSIVILGIDVSTGKEVRTIVNSANMNTMKWDQATKSVYGLSYTEQGRALVSFDTTGTFKNHGLLPDHYTIISGSVTAIDQKGQRLFAIMSNETTADSEPASTNPIRLPGGLPLYRAPGTHHKLVSTAGGHEIRLASAPPPPGNFKLVTVHIPSVTVPSAPLLCQQDPQCPWSLDYYNQQ